MIAPSASDVRTETLTTKYSVRPPVAFSTVRSHEHGDTQLVDDAQLVEFSLHDGQLVEPPGTATVTAAPEVRPRAASATTSPVAPTPPAAHRAGIGFDPKLVEFSDAQRADSTGVRSKSKKSTLRAGGGVADVLFSGSGCSDARCDGVDDSLVVNAFAVHAPAYLAAARGLVEASSGLVLELKQAGRGVHVVVACGGVRGRPGGALAADRGRGDTPVGGAARSPSLAALPWVASVAARAVARLAVIAGSQLLPAPSGRVLL